jgi:hypothetical protein
MLAIIRMSVAIVVLAVPASGAYAQSVFDGPWEKFSISVGGFVSESDTTMQVNSKTLGVGAIVDLEDALGVESSFQTYRIDAVYRFGQTRRHQIEFHYFDSNRTGDNVLDQNLQIGDKFFPAGTGVTTEFDLRFANFDYAYNFLMDDRVRFGVSAGLHTTGVGLKVAATDGSVAENESFTAPLPVIGLRADVVLAPRWRLKADLNVFYLEYDGFTGRIGDTLLSIEYIPFKNFGFGIGLNSINYRVEGDGDDPNGMDFNGQIKFELNGALIYGKYFF